ncbi:heterogeneous nuclear ribonucleoprotein C-like [Lontra canadensis]|uniref:heterogeneous nuclear ribonucleoprotein C-like n=1 Tax=Lontra canadensis TaxID=76717 RepID=UPI0013F2D16F|nr:heterogeneous nuclear ribonucleoprotein C-like [Lontra canadensis]
MESDPLSICLCCSRSNYDLGYKLYREDVPYRVYEYQRIPPLISRVPVKIRKTQVRLGVKGSFSPHKGTRKSHLPREQIKLQTEELHSIRGELSQIKAQVDRLLENLECMDQQRDQLPGGTPTVDPGHIPRSEDSEETKGPGSKGSSCRITDLQQDPRGQSAHPESDSFEDSADPEEAGKNHASDLEGSQY